MTRATVALALVGLLGGTTLAAAQKAPPRKVKDVSPVFPRLALEKGDEGVVVVEMGVNADGAVETVRVLRSSCSRLTDAAVAAARQWRFEAVTIDKRPTPYTMTASVPFRLDSTKPRARAADACRWPGVSGPLR
jgi:periplasmic protein TonB